MFKKITKLAAVAIFAMTIISSAYSAEEIKPLREWIKIMEQEEKEMAKADPLFYQIQAGAAYKHIGHNHFELSEVLKARKVFEEFMTKRGNEMTKQWIANGYTLPENQKLYRYILNIAYIHKAYFLKKGKRGLKKLGVLPKDFDKEKCKAYYTKINTLGKGIKSREKINGKWKNLYKNGLVVKGYKTAGKYTRKETENLRLYRGVLEAGHTNPPGMKITPVRLGIYNANLQAGKPAPDFTALYTDTILDGEKYNDNITDFPHNIIRYLQPIGLKEFSLMYEGYTYENDTVIARNIPLPKYIKEKDAFRLSSFKGKKPVVLFFAEPCDITCWHGKNFIYLQPLFHAYKDKIEFCLVNVTVGDTYMGNPAWFGEHAGDSVKFGHHISYEERAMSDKILYMGNPEFSFPRVLDNMSRTIQNAYAGSAGGAGVFYVIDKNGNFAFPGKSRYLDGKHKSYANKRLDGKKGQENIITTNVRRALFLDTMLADLIKNDSIYNADFLPKQFPPKLISKKYDPKSQKQKWVKRGIKPNTSKGEHMRTLWLYAIVKSNNNGSISVIVPKQKADDYPAVKYWQDPKAKLSGRPEVILPIVKKWINGTEEERTYTFKTDDTTDVYLNGSESNATALKTGDKVGIKYYSFQEKNDIIFPEIIRIFRTNE